MPLPPPKNLNVLAVDDTVTYRAILKETLSGVAQATLVDAAKNGQDALDKLATLKANGKQIDLVLLDVEMPVMDGMETLKRIKQQYRNIAVVMVSGANSKSANLTFKALEAGALDFVPKPDGGSAYANIKSLQEKLQPIIQHVLDQPSSRPAVAKKPAIHAQPLKKADDAALRKVQTKLFHAKVVAIGISTGGPNALKSLIPKLNKNLGLPIVVVIHMPEKFTGYLAESLNRLSALSVKEAAEGDVLEANTVYIAPGGRHTVVKNLNGKPTVCINDDPPENNCRPAVDVLFRSLPAVYPSGILNIIMTGMGSDGLKGVQHIRRQHGHFTLNQSADSCTVYGMPKAIDDAGLSDEIASLNEMPQRIDALTNLSKLTGIAKGTSKLS